MDRCRRPVLAAVVGHEGGTKGSRLLAAVDAGACHARARVASEVEEAWCPQAQTAAAAQRTVGAWSATLVCLAQAWEAQIRRRPRASLVAGTT